MKEKDMQKLRIIRKRMLNALYSAQKKSWIVRWVQNVLERSKVYSVWTGNRNFRQYNIIMSTGKTTNKIM